MEKQRASIRPDTVIAGKYRLLALLAEGGMGAVWRAEDLRLRATVAVKVMHFADTQNPETRARFEAEAGIAAQLRSPHVVQILDVGVDPDINIPFIVMELLEGECLRDLLARSGPLPPAAVVRIVSQVARALTRAHELSIIHRDLKPANIFLVRDGETELAKVLDFGIAKHRSRAGRGRTVTGDLLGTPMYMSPEQIVSSKDVDHHSDLWSLAVIAVECLTGRLPFDSDNLPGLAMAICQGNATLPSQLGPVPPGFDEWFETATRLQPHERFSSAAQLADELRKVCAAVAPEVLHDSQRVESQAARSLHQTLQPASLNPGSRTLVLQPRRLQHRQRLLAGVAAAVLLLAGGYALLLPRATTDAAPPVAAALAPAAAPAAAAAPAEAAASGPSEATAALRPGGSPAGTATSEGAATAGTAVSEPAPSVKPVAPVTGHGVGGVGTPLVAPATPKPAAPANRRPPARSQPAPARPQSAPARSQSAPARPSPPRAPSPATDPHGLGF